MEFFRHVKADGADGCGSSRKHAARMRRPEIGRDPMAIALPLDQPARVNSGGQIRRKTGGMGRHQQVTVVRSRVVQRHGLHRIIEGCRAAQRTEGLRLDTARRPPDRLRRRAPAPVGTSGWIGCCGGTRRKRVWRRMRRSNVRAEGGARSTAWRISRLDWAHNARATSPRMRIVRIFS